MLVYFYGLTGFENNGFVFNYKLFFAFNYIGVLIKLRSLERLAPSCRRHHTGNAYLRIFIGGQAEMLINEFSVRSRYYKRGCLNSVFFIQIKLIQKLNDGFVV